MDDVTKKVPKVVSTLSHNIKYLRKGMKISQEVLSKELGIKRSNIAAYESKNVEPRLSVILQMASFFNVSVQGLLQNKITNEDYPRNDTGNKEFLNEIDVDSAIDLQDFVEKSNKIRKVLEGFKAFYSFKKENMKGDFEGKDKILSDIDNFLQLMEHLLSYNETVIGAIDNSQQASAAND